MVRFTNNVVVILASGVRQRKLLRSEDSESLQLANPITAGTETGHVEPRDLLQVLLARNAHGQQLLVVGITRAREDMRWLP